mmetsp:Transcript_22857/g.39106  ORF Transcript_22857/g.39106 Transcript_22857/m.39106 type:complete len:96 (+) Transcript_22857:196-483(+)
MMMRRNSLKLVDATAAGWMKGGVDQTSSQRKTRISFELHPELVLGDDIGDIMPEDKFITDDFLDEFDYDQDDTVDCGFGNDTEHATKKGFAQNVI